MKTFTAEELREILSEHKKWLNDSDTGARADLIWANLREADLSGADLREANLRWADLSGADLIWANLSEANLHGANLSGADLYGANLRGAYLRGADLREADLREADLHGANLSGADLRGANLYGADLREADLREADLREADLYEANLRGANLRGANLQDAIINWPLVCPEKGSFTAFKKIYAPDGTNLIAELQIPKDALRSSATSRKCRCSKAKVIAFTNLDGSETDIKQAHSGHDKYFIYTVGKTVKASDFDPNRWNECAPGIHFFITRQETVEY